MATLTTKTLIKPPSDFTHCLLCLHSYENLKTDEDVKFINEHNVSYNNHLIKWKVKQIFQFDFGLPFCAVLYENSSEKQMVFACRDKPVFHSVRLQEGIHDFTDTQNHSEPFTISINILEEAIINDYYLSFTGYNLGGFLAQLCFANCYKQTAKHHCSALIFNKIEVLPSCKEPWETTYSLQPPPLSTPAIKKSVTLINFPTKLDMYNEQSNEEVLQLPLLSSKNVFEMHSFAKYGHIQMRSIAKTIKKSAMDFFMKIQGKDVQSTLTEETKFEIASVLYEVDRGTHVKRTFSLTKDQFQKGNLIIIRLNEQVIPSAFEQIEMSSFKNEKPLEFLNFSLQQSKEHLQSRLFHLQIQFFDLNLPIDTLSSTLNLTAEKLLQEITTYDNKCQNALINQIKETPLTWKVFQYLSFLNVQSIELNILKCLVNEENIEISINSLQELGCVHVHYKDKEAVSMHVCDQHARDIVRQYISNEEENALKASEIINQFIITFSLKFTTFATDKDWEAANCLYRYISGMRLHIKQEIPNLSKETKQSLCNLYNNVFWFLFHIERNYVESLEIVEELLMIMQQYFCHDYKSIALTKAYLGKTLQLLGQVEKAEEIISSALKDHYEHACLNSDEIATIYKMLAVSLDSLGNYDKAKLFIEKSLKVKKKHLSLEHETFSTSLYCKSLILHHLEEFDEAIQCFHKCIYLQEEECHNNEDEVLSNYYTDLAHCYGDADELEKCLEYHQKSLKLRTMFLKEDHPLIATSLNNIGICYYNYALFDTALDFFNKSLNISKDSLTLEEKDATISRCLSNIGFCYFGHKSYQIALDYYKQALKITQQDSTSLFISHDLYNLAFCYRQLGKEDKARKLFQESYKIKQNIFEDHHQHLHTCCQCRGHCSFTRSQLESTLNFLIEILKENIAKFGKLNYENAQNLDNIAFCYRDMGNFMSALNYHTNALLVRQEIYKSDLHFDIGMNLFNLGVVYLHLKDAKASLNCLEEALNIFNNIVARNHVSIAATKRNIKMAKSYLPFATNFEVIENKTCHLH